MSNLTPAERADTRAHVFRFLGNLDYPDLPAMLTETMLARADLEDLAAERSAENYVGTMEVWAKTAGTIFAEAAREAFRAAERRVREERQHTELERRRLERGRLHAGTL